MHVLSVPHRHRGSVDALAIAHRLTDAAFDTWQEIRGRDDLHEVVGQGADGTATMRVDQLLDDAILEEALALDVGVVSEESGRRDAGQEIWAYVDPLDGSRNAARGVPFFCTSIAVATGEGPDALKAGIVRNLVSGDLYEAGRGTGVLLNGEAPRPRPFTRAEAMVAIIADSGTPDLQHEREHHGHHVRDLGSAALELALVSVGALDAMVVRQPWLRSIDVAAGAVLVEEAGGRASDPGGGPLELNFDVKDRLGIIAARSEEAWEAVR